MKIRNIQVSNMMHNYFTANCATYYYNKHIDKCSLLPTVLQSTFLKRQVCVLPSGSDLVFVSRCSPAFTCIIHLRPILHPLV